MEELEKSKKPALALSDASAGFIAAVLLFLVQKLPDGSDAKQLYMYASPVLAIAFNNIISIFIQYGKYLYRRKLLSSRYKDLSSQRSEYMKVGHADAEVVNEYNQAIKKTQIAIINTSLVDLGKDAAAQKPKRTVPPRNNLPPSK
ncbi:hypothetical protein [Pseudomonas sp. A-RE-19]|uniref:hypothetical protein n=1 Tax=Pseudomonas sp. A-RE-19 TaxID=2832401 RepID=UPI001CBE7B5A|nr:hypothetical protein [Pseudomonas sp. A-RE-19]